jgi:sugar-specific transcriptional regulator TrmB
METESLLEVLEAAGFSPYQAEAYVALLDRGNTPVARLARESTVPKPRIYDVLDSLEDEEYVETFENGSRNARVQSPDRMTERLRDLADRFERAADEVEARWTEPDLQGNHATIVRRSERVIERAISFIDSAEHQVHLSATALQFDRLEGALQRAHDRGVSIRLSIHTDPGESPPDRDFSEVSLEARHRPFPGPFVLLADRAKTCFVQHPDAADIYGIVVDGRTHAHDFHWYFRTCLWEGWAPIHTVHDDEYPVEYLDIRQCIRQVEPLVEAGATVTVQVEGYDTEEGEHCTIEGVVTGTTSSAPVDKSAADYRPGRVSMRVDTGAGDLTVGGWGAMLEHVEATHITVLDVTDPDGGTALDTLTRDAL